MTIDLDPDLWEDEPEEDEDDADLYVVESDIREDAQARLTAIEEQADESTLHFPGGYEDPDGPDMPEEDEEPEPVAPVSGNQGRPIWSGHCQFPQTAEPHLSHERCARGGCGSRANPKRLFHPCPCACHLGDEYECGNCGKIIRETTNWTGDGTTVYVHVDHEGNATSEECA